MAGSKKLMAALDYAAEQLLARHFPGFDPEDPLKVIATEPEVQIKAFSAVVNYYGPRTKLGGDEERTKSGISRLQEQLHGRGKAGRKAGKAESGSDAGELTGHQGSDAEPAGVSNPGTHTNGSGDPAGGSE